MTGIQFIDHKKRETLEGEGKHNVWRTKSKKLWRGKKEKTFKRRVRRNTTCYRGGGWGGVGVFWGGGVGGGGGLGGGGGGELYAAGVCKESVMIKGKKKTAKNGNR